VRRAGALSFLFRSVERGGSPRAPGRPGRPRTTRRHTHPLCPGWGRESRAAGLGVPSCPTRALPHAPPRAGTHGHHGQHPVSSHRRRRRPAVRPGALDGCQPKKKSRLLSKARAAPPLARLSPPPPSFSPSLTPGHSHSTARTPQDWKRASTSTTVDVSAVAGRPGEVRERGGRHWEGGGARQSAAADGACLAMQQHALVETPPFRTLLARGRAAAAASVHLCSQAGLASPNARRRWCWRVPLHARLAGRAQPSVVSAHTTRVPNHIAHSHTPLPASSPPACRHPLHATATSAQARYGAGWVGGAREPEKREQRGDGLLCRGTRG